MGETSIHFHIFFSSETPKRKETKQKRDSPQKCGATSTWLRQLETWSEIVGINCYQSRRDTKSGLVE